MQTLTRVPGSFAICRFHPTEAVPEWAHGENFSSVTRTPTELSIVCSADEEARGDARCEWPWRCWRVSQAHSLDETGVLASLVSPLAAAGMSIFSISTFDTDYLFVKAEDFEAAEKVLLAAGHVIQ